MPDSNSFKEKQRAFAAHIRDPDNVPPPPGIEDRRMAVYRNLFFNNLKSLLSATFPVLRKIHSEDRWRHLVREFMRTHRARTPYFLELPAEFLSFLADEYEPAEADYPFLAELAHYEHIELALAVSTSEDDVDGFDPTGDLLSGTPVRSALCWVFAYQFPVHRISPDYLPDAPLPEPVYLAVCRDEHDKVRFVELNPLMARLLEVMSDNPDNLSGRQILHRMASEIGYADVDAFTGHGAEALESLRAKGMLIGVRNT